MGRKRNRKNKDVACQADPSYNKFPSNLPQIIPIETFSAIADYMLQLPAPQRNVFLTAKEYSMEHINPMHIRTKDSPTHMVVFCLRLIMSDHFNPIGVVQINKRVEYIKKLAVVWKAFIQDLSILRIFVIGSMSPCTLTFHDVLIEITQNPNLEDNTGPITYSVWPYKDILHLYDYYSLIEEFVEAFYDRNEVFFLTHQPPSEKMSDSKSKNLQLYCASWNDIQLTTTVSVDIDDENMGPDELILNKRFRNAYRALSKKALTISKALGIWRILMENGNNVIFKAGLLKLILDDKSIKAIASFIFSSFTLTASEQGNGPESDKLSILSTETRSSTDRLLDLLWQYVDITFTNINLNPYALQELYDKHEDFRIALATAQFRWYVIEVSTLDTPSAEPKVSSEGMHVTNQLYFEREARDTSPMDQDSLRSGSSIELNDNEINNLISDLSNEDTYFDKFLRKIVYDDYDLYIKTCPTVGSTVAQSAEEAKRIASLAQRALIHDHDYFSGANDEDDSTEIESESETTKMLREYFGDLKQKRKKLVQDSQNSLDQNSNATVGNKEHIFKINENMDEEYKLNAKCDNNNHADQKLSEAADFSGQQLFGASNMHNVYKKIDSRRIKQFQYEMQQLTASINEIVPSMDQKNSPVRKPCRGLRLIPYPKPGSSNKDILNSNFKWEYSQPSIMIDSLDLANCNAHIHGDDTECTMDSAINHCSDENALDIEKPVADDTLTRSVDSLVELVSTFDADQKITNVPSKHIILKSKTRKVREVNIPGTIGNLEKWNRPVNSLKSSKSDSVLYIKKRNFSETVTSLAPRKVWKQPRNICCLPKLKSPVQELKELMKSVSSLNVCSQSVDVERGLRTCSIDYNNIFLKSFSCTKPEKCQEINRTSTNGQEGAKKKMSTKNHTVDQPTRNTSTQDDVEPSEIGVDSFKARFDKIHMEHRNPRPNSDGFGSFNNTLPGFDSEGHIGTFLDTMAPATPKISSTRNTFHLKDTMEVDEIDYQNYRKNLVSILGDYKKPHCDTFRDKDAFNMLYGAIPPESETVRVTNDWLCTFKGYLKLKEILDRRKVKFVRAKLLCLDHIDFFVALIRKLKNNVLSTVYEGPGYRFVDYKCAFDMLYSGDGVYILTQDEDTVISL